MRLLVLHGRGQMLVIGLRLHVGERLSQGLSADNLSQLLLHLLAHSQFVGVHRVEPPLPQQV